MKRIVSRQEKINKSYKSLAARYDAMLAANNWWSKLLCKIIWGFPDTVYTKRLLDWIPDDFDGKLLDIPVRTGLFTANKYTLMKKADITCVDYSLDMMQIALTRFQSNGIGNVAIRHGDVGNLNFPDGVFDIVLMTAVFCLNQQI